MKPWTLASNTSSEYRWCEFCTQNTLVLIALMVKALLVYVTLKKSLSSGNGNDWGDRPQESFFASVQAFDARWSWGCRNGEQGNALYTQPQENTSRMGSSAFVSKEHRRHGEQLHVPCVKPDWKYNKHLDHGGLLFCMFSGRFQRANKQRSS